MNIVFPIAGRGTRFCDNEYNVPKPLYIVNGKSLLEWSITTLKLPGKYIFITLQYTNDDHNKQIEKIIQRTCNDYCIIVTAPTAGAAETCLKATSLINNDTPLVITNGDQYLNWDHRQFINHIRNTNPDACVSTYEHDDIQYMKPSKYAFVKLNDQRDRVIEFREKFAFSHDAMNGIHYWKRGSDFIASANKLMLGKLPKNDEYYLSSSFQFMIEQDKIINTYHMLKDQYRSLGSPAEINKNQQYII